MKVLSLFSGVGGFDLGLERAGMETVFQCEWDKHATKILERHWPDVPRWDDVSTLTGKHILAHAPVIDIVAWGSPCQDLSVAGKRAGLEGSRSGLFHEGIRIIKELRKETNNVYPRISLWENVYGALNSNKGADFGVILDEMAEAGSLVQEWRVLDAQYFGVPQRRRRVFLVSVFDTATAARCPDPLLPVSESVRRDTPTSGTPGQEPTRTTTQGTRSSRAIIGSDIVGSLNASDWKFPQQQQVHENKCVVETFTKAKRAQTTTDDETWVEGKPAPTLNSFDQGDTRATTVVAFATNQRDEVRDLDDMAVALSAERGTNQQTYIAFENSYRDGVRIATEDVSQTLSAKVGSGGNNTPMVAQAIPEPMLSFDTQFGSNANVFENQSPTLKASQAAPSVAIPIHDQATRHSGKRGTKSDGKGNGFGIGNEGDPMNTLTSGDRHAVAYDEYNHTLGGDVHHALRAGTKQSTGVVVDNEIVGTLRSGGDGGVPSSRGEHLVVSEAAGFKAGQSAQAGIGFEEGVSQTINANMSGLEPTVLTPTMAVRRLTPIECERLMGWPDGWTEGQADTHRYKQCGNGVASPVATWIAQQLLQLDKEPDAPPTTTTT